MQWLTPITGLIAAGAAVPLLVLLYFLKLKRRDEFVSSTLLWKRAVQDLQVNAPFQKLRRNILLLLQLLALSAVLFALAGPILSLTAGAGRRYVLLIDRSASMSARDEKTGRLSQAKKQARKIVESLRGRTTFSLQDTSDQAMVVAFDSHARVMCNFTSDKRQLAAAIDSIQPTDGKSSLTEAVTVAQAFAQSPGEDANNRSAETPATLELFSDGRIGDLEQILLSAGDLNFHCIGQSAENIAVTALQARRSYELPEQVDVFAAVSNSGPKAVRADVQLSVDGNVRAVRSVMVPPKAPGDAQKPLSGGKVSISFTLNHAGAGVIEVRQLRPDLLECDDAAWAVLAPPKKLSLLLVTKGNSVLSSALKSCSPARMDVRTPDQFDAMDHAAMSAAAIYDVIVLDNYVPAALPRGRYLIFGHPPREIGVEVKEQLKNQVVVDWRQRHPVLQFVVLGNLFASKCRRMSLPRNAEVLAEFTETPAIAIVRKGGSAMLLVGFDAMETNWPFEPGFVMFCYNSIHYLGLEIGRERRGMLEVGQAVTIEGLPPETDVEIAGPDFSARKIKTDASGVFRYPGTDRAGVYRVVVGENQPKYFAVNLLDADESNIEPVREIVLSGRTVKAEKGSPRQSNVPLWPWLAAIALALVCLEWFVYNSKVRL
ncbi:MAG: VWA domain-containing protein [Planctomycetota bacterium]|nr:VWA domain-containing protein [Planctomycetota bacterium]